MSKIKVRFIATLLGVVMLLLLVIGQTIAYGWTSTATYVSDVAISTSSTATLVSNGYTLYSDTDLNKGAGGDYEYIGWKTTTDYNDAIKSMVISTTNAVSITYNGYTYYRATCFGNNNGDLNSNAGGMHMWLYYTKEPVTSGNALTTIGIAIGSSSNQSLPSGCSEWIHTTTSTNKVDVNEDSGGKYIYIAVGKASHTHNLTYTDISQDSHVETCDGCSYSSTQPHNYVNGLCDCGTPQPAALNAEGIYEISNYGQLVWFEQYVNAGNYDTDAVLTANIMANEDLVSADGSLNGTPQYTWTPIGGLYWTGEDLYLGTFDGANHTISGLYYQVIKDGYRMGLFGACGTDAVVKNVIFKDSYFCTDSNVGFVCGYNSGGLITNCISSGGYISSSATAGGLCGNNSGTITDCRNSGKLVSINFGGAGGVCGNNSGTITGCSNSGNINGMGTGLGGVCETNSGTITNCFNSGDIHGNGDANISQFVGGVCGYNASDVTNCFNVGNVSSVISGNKGSVCGRNKGGTITNCYYNSTVSSIGGIEGSDVAGSAEGKSTAKFASGAVAYRLNGSTSEGTLAWYQNLDNGKAQDSYPVLDSGHGIVYKTYYYSNFSGTKCLKPEDGEGTKDYPYEIANAGNLYWFAEKVNDAGGHDRSICAVLTADITLNKNLLNADGSLNDISDFEWTPIGNTLYQDNGVFYDWGYVGTFDGAGHTISGLYCNDDSATYVGLFGYCGDGSAIKNVTVADSYFYGKNTTVGGICAFSWGAITNCNSSASIVGNKGYVGGVCGSIDGTITSCSNSGSINCDGYSRVGGVCGYNSGTIKNCINTASVSNSATVDEYDRVGGVCGYNIGTIENCINTGSVSGNNSTGGLCGVNGATIESCINSGSVVGNEYAGGICGGNDRIVTKCYYNSTVCSVGGINGSDVAGSAEGKTTEQLASGEVTYLLNGSTSEGTLTWYQNIDNDGTIDSLPTFDSTHGVVYPYYNDSCAANGYSNTQTNVDPHQFVNGICRVCGAFDTTEPAINDDGYYEIANAGNLYWFAAKVNGSDVGEQNTAACAVLTADITVNENVLNADGSLNGTPDFVWTPIGKMNYAETDDFNFCGTFDGAGHTISGLYCTSNNNNSIGLFCICKEGGIIKNVNVTDSYFYSSSQMEGIGGISALSYGIITNCSFTGNINSITIATCGGVCGYNQGTITGCASSANVSSEYIAGGVCGTNYGTVTSCISNGNVSGDSNVGGVFGYNSDNSAVTNCYYNSTVCSVGGINGSNVAGSAEGKTTEQLASGEVTYLLNGSTSEGTLTWYQNIDNDGTIDSLPTFDSTHGVVYPYYNDSCTANGYSNTQTNANPHLFVNGICTACGAFDTTEPAINDDGYYEIANAGNLYWFAAKVNGSDVGKQNTAACAVLTADITVNENVLNADGSLNGTPDFAWTPIGIYNFSFDGTFDGAGYTISGLYCNNNINDSIGLFGLCGMVGIIKNVNVTDSYFYSGNDYVAIGGISGDNYGTITNCCFTGNIDGSSSSGGVCGNNWGTIKLCTNNGNIHSESNVGGVCGKNESHNAIENCINNGNVSGNNCIGGVCGTNSGDTIKNCISSGNVSGKSWVGGVCGFNNYSFTITNCYYNSTVCSVGGIGINESDVAGSAVGKTTKQFASGEVAYILNGLSPEGVWKQTIGTDATPIFTGKDVYYNATNGYFNLTLGDVDCSGAVDNIDVALIQKLIAGLITQAEFEESYDYDLADYNADLSVDLLDVIAILKAIAV